MNNLLSIDKLIEEARSKGVNFGKGDPYNRLRYYTKIGWLPHMIRKSDSDGGIKGHYPDTALEQLVFIENLKEQGATNDEISNKLKSRNKLQNLAISLSNKENRNQIVMYTLLILVTILLANQLELINIGKPKSQIVSFPENTISKVIMDSGTSFVPKNQSSVFIKNQMVSKTLKINVTFNSNYSPATRYWVSDIQDFRGFTLQLDAPVYDSAEFNWWLSN